MKIEIFVHCEYKVTTTRCKTLKAAKARYLYLHPYLKANEVICKFA